MYAQYFGLNEKPFSIAPDPRYLYQSERHAEALAHLLYGVEEAGGFIQLTGEVGTGKTTLTRALLNQLPSDVEVAMILNPRLSTREFLQTICKELKMGWAVHLDSAKRLIDILNEHLLDAHANGRHVVLIIDEAQNLDVDLLEQIRLLTNLETSERKLLQIILIGQPELRQTLSRTDMRQLAQRITGRYHLDPLDRAQTAAYIKHRLSVAGATREIFTPAAIREIHREADGVPRLINVICDRAMLGAYSRERPMVDARLARQAAAEVHGRKSRSGTPRWLEIAAAVAVMAIVGGAGYQFWQTRQASPESPVQASTTGEAATATGSGGAPSARTDPPAGNPASGPAATATRAAAMQERPPIVEEAAEQQPAAQAETPFELSELLASTRDLTDNHTAFRQLFSLWGKAYVQGSTRACPQAEAQGLKCMFQRGSWNHLVTLNIPAIISLTDPAGEDHQIVLEELINRDLARIRIGESSYPVAVDQIVDLWFGDSLLLWRPHPQAGRLLGPGARGAGVKWLRDGLESLGLATPGNADPMLYDAELAERVRVFQRDYGLRVDGIAGERTLVKLQVLLLEPGIPLLRKDG